MTDTEDKTAPTYERGQCFLVEYQKAQDSAEHHDTLLWTVTSILWAAIVLLLGSALDAVGESGKQLLVTMYSVLGIGLTLTSAAFVFLLNHIKNQKYARCKELEERWGFTQHKGLNYPRWLPMKIIYLLVTIYLIVLWGIIIGKNDLPAEHTPQSVPAICACPRIFIQCHCSEAPCLDVKAWPE